MTVELQFRDENVVCYDDLLEQMRSIHNEERKLIGNVSTVCKLLAVNPATWMQFYTFIKSKQDCLDLIDVANSFTDSNDNRKSQFGQFTTKHLKCC